MDKDLASVQEARELLERAHEAQQAFSRVSQEVVDRVVTAMAKAASAAAERLARMAVDAGAPKNLVLAMQSPTLEGTSELMRHKRTAIILATGGYPMVRAAYSSGKPAYGVGPGNVPAIVERTADVPKAVRDIINGKCFDQGVLCSAENSLVCDAPVDAQVKAELPKNGAFIVRGEDRVKLQRAMQ